MPQLQIALLGPPEIYIDGSPVRTDRRKAIALLAYLAVTGRAQPRDHLAALLWPDYPKDSAYAYLRRTIWELNNILGKGWIEADRERASLVSNGDLWLDTAGFQELIQNQEDRIPALSDAVKLHRGDFLAGFTVEDTAPFEEWQIQQVEYFRRELAEALELLVELHAQTGDYETALPYGRRWLALDVLNETAHRALIRLLAEMGDRTGAIRQYESCVQILKSELGVDPLQETAELYESVLRGELRGEPVDSGEIASQESSGVSHLPVMPTPFIGRRSEVEQVKLLVKNDAVRLLTLTGPGGTGKTRLSIEAASELEEIFPDGVYFVPLAPVGTGDGMILAAAKAVGFSFFREEETPRQQLLDFLRKKQQLLILDNFEHRMEDTGLIREILADAAGVKLIVTSRVRLNLQGEQLYPVGGMRVPEVVDLSRWDHPEELVNTYSALHLFLDRARLVDSGFELNRENAAAVTEICQLVEGMPLALELAAAWVELLSPEEIAAEISASLDFLETDQVDVPDRQRSIRAVFESSWKLLSTAEQQAFLSLCVFTSSFSREAAQQVSGASLRSLLGLSSKSFLQQTEGGRFQLHELMHQYGLEILQADQEAWQAARDRHGEYFAGFVANQALRMQGPEQIDGLLAMEDEFDTNIKAAWDWLVSERRWNDLLESMVEGLFQFGSIAWKADKLVHWYKGARLAASSDPHREGQLAYAVFGTNELNCEDAMRMIDADFIERLSSIWQMVNQQDLAEPMGMWFVILASKVRYRNLAPDVDGPISAAIDRLRGQDSLWQLGIGLGFNAGWFSDYVNDEASLLEAAAIFEELGVISERGAVAETLGVYAYKHRRPPAELTRYYEQARSFYQQLKGHSALAGINLAGLADIYFQQGDYERGFALFEDERKEMQRLGQTRLLRFNMHWESLFAARYGSYEHALGLRKECLELTRSFGSPSELPWQQFELGEVHRIFGARAEALGLYDQARPRFIEMNLIQGLGFDQRAQGDLALADDQYSEARSHYQKYYASAKETNHPWAMAQARAKIALANAYLGETDEARQDIYLSLTEILTFPYDDLALQILLAEGVCLLQEEDFVAAAELVSFLLEEPGSWNETRQHASEILETISAHLPQDVFQAAVEQGKALELVSILAGLTASEEK